MVKHFLSIKDFSSEELGALLALSEQLKQMYRNGERDLCMAGKTMVLLFEKPSSRTRISFQVTAAQLDGSAIYIRPEDIGGLGQREPIRDLARVLNGYVDIIVARTFSHETVEELANYATIPVINALTDWSHPCQAMADMLTIKEHFGKLKGLKLAFIGDGNNVAQSLAMACAKLDLIFTIATPAGYALSQDFMEKISSVVGEDQFQILTDPFQAVQDADIIYTDTWTSMGQEQEKQQRMKDFQGYQVNMDLLKAAGANAKVMHCLPAYRGLEITDEVIESPQNIIFDQAENRLHFQRALVKYLLVQ
ncbi:MAG: ornithine carbamoyltransferase [Sedimentisphaerales bacterium]|nr:ornithine carbamoyltransferase [Sedimentisphaerales bacterium]